MQNRGFRGIWLPSAIWFDERLSPLDKVVLMEIDSLDSSENGCFASNEYLAKFCQCSVRKVTSAVSKLIEFGYIKVVSFDGRKRHLKSTLTIAKSASQPSKKCEAGWQNVRPYKIDNNTTDTKKEKRKKRALLGGIDIARRDYTPEQLQALFTPMDEEAD